MIPCISLVTVAFMVAFVAAASNNAATYMAVIKEIEGTDSGVSGLVVVFSDPESASLVGYAGIVDGLMPDLLASTCNATNGCGVHIHNGTSCGNSTLQGGHYFVAPVTVDPWIDARYSSDVNGTANFAGILEIGTDEVEGRPFLVHAENGTRIGCGILESVSDVLATTTEELTDAGVTGDATVVAVENAVCYFGAATNLERDLVSFLDGGMDCNFTNGCGVHIHSGTNCFNTTTQGGHFYNMDLLASDPWKYTSYLSTDANGEGYFTGCVETGETSFVSRAFIVHANNGSRLSCGILDLVEPTLNATPTTAGAPTPAGAPTAARVPTAPALPPVKAPTGSTSAAVSRFSMTAAFTTTAMMVYVAAL